MKEIDSGCLPTLTTSMVTLADFIQAGFSSSNRLSYSEAKNILPTLTVNDSKQNGSISQLNRNTIAINTVVKLPTLMASGKIAGGSNACKTLKKLVEIGFFTETEIKGLRGISIDGALNPAWCEAYMGWPVGWTKMESLKSLLWWKISRFAHPTIPLLTQNKENRVKRIRCLGGGMVPQCFFRAFKILLKGYTI